MNQMNHSNIFVSYILITYNRIDDLNLCIESIKQQRYKNYEIVLVDNNSSDNTAKIIHEKYPEIKLIASSENLGVPEARNLGIKNSAGEILIFIDDDCIIDDNDLTTKVIRYFKSNDRLGILAFKIINYYTKQIDRFAFPHTNKKLSDQEFETSYFVGAGHAISRKVIDDVGLLFGEYFYGFEELDYSFRVVSKNYMIIYSPDVIVFHKVTPQARPTWRNVYYFTRNRIWFVYSFLPWYFIVTHFFIWMFYFFVVSVRIHRVSKFFLGLKDGLMKIKALRFRRDQLKLSKHVIRKLRSLKGRLLY